MTTVHNERSGSERLVADGGQDPYYDVCEECGRHIAVVPDEPVRD
jgi:hypothetical protein